MSKEKKHEEGHRWFSIRKNLFIKFIKANGGSMIEMDICNKFYNRIKVGKEPNVLVFEPLNPSTVIDYLDRLKKQDYVTVTKVDGGKKVWTLTNKAIQNYNYNRKRLKEEFGNSDGLVYYILRRRKEIEMKKEKQEEEKRKRFEEQSKQSAQSNPEGVFIDTSQDEPDRIP